MQLGGKRHKVVLYNPQRGVSSRCRWRCWRSARNSTRSLRSGDRRCAARCRRRERPCSRTLGEALCLGVTVLTGAPISDALRISRAAKRCGPGSAGGLGRLAPVDVFAGMPARAVGGRHRARAGRGNLRRDRRTAWRQAGLWTTAPAARCGCADGSIRENPARPLAQVDKFRAHDYGLIPVERYFELKGKRQLDYISSQGCNFRCAFCSDPFVYGRKWVGLEPVRMALRLKELWDRYHFDDVNFQDETFFTTRRPRRGIGRSDRRIGHEDHLGGDHARGPGRAAARRGLGALQAVGTAPPVGRRRVRLQ